MHFDSEIEACRAWVRDFHNIPSSLLERAYKEDMDELVLLAGGERKSNCCDEEVTEHADEDGDVTLRCGACERDCESHWSGAQDGWPAAWGTLFNPGDSSDERWMRNNAEEIAAKCGFLVYECEEVGILLAVDGAGYDFYEGHWLPLYRLRGLGWHETAR